jgi:hypothetical protein
LDDYWPKKSKRTKKNFDRLNKRLKDSISFHFNSGKIVGNKIERAFLKIYNKFFKPSYNFNINFWHKSKNFFDIYFSEDNFIKCSKDLIKDMHVFLDDSIKINLKKKEFFRKVKRYMSPLKRQYIYNLQYILFKKVKVFFDYNKLKFG